MAIESFAKGTQPRCRFLGRSDVRIIMSADDAPLMRHCHEQNAQMKSQRRLLGGITGDRRRSRAHAAKSPIAQVPALRPIKRKASRAAYGQDQTGARMTTFMTGIRKFMKAHAILWQRFYACFSEYTFKQGHQVLVCGRAAHLDIGDRVSMQTGCLSPVTNRPISAARAIRICTPRHGHETVPTPHATKQQQPSTCCQIKEGSSELQII